MNQSTAHSFTIFSMQMTKETAARGDGIWGCPRPNGHLGLYVNFELAAESVWRVPPGKSWWDYPDKVFELVAEWRNALQLQQLMSERRERQINLPGI